MTCDHCEQTVKETVTQLDGVEQVDVQVQQEQVNLEYDNSEISLEAICTAIEEQGYAVVR